MYCLDWEKHGEDLALWGKFSSSNFQSISINLVPCNFVYPGLEDHFSVTDECERDEVKQRNFLKTITMELYMEEKFFR